MRGKWLRSLFLCIGIIVILVSLGLAFIYSGILSVAANYPDPAPIAWVFDKTFEHSVKRHAVGIQIPSLDDHAMVKTGFRLYAKSCEGCHAAPGVEQAEVTKSFNPEPPELAESAGDWKANELFWITKNGVRMTGMPAWGSTYSDKQIWSIVAAARKLADTKPEEYAVLSAETSARKK